MHTQCTVKHVFFPASDSVFVSFPPRKPICDLGWELASRWVFFYLQTPGCHDNAVGSSQSEYISHPWLFVYMSRAKGSARKKMEENEWNQQIKIAAGSVLPACY